MARIVILDDYPHYAEMVGIYLHAKGHEVMADVIPFDLEAIQRFGPELVVVSLVRKVEALGQPLIDFYKEVDGARAMIQLQESGSLLGVPVVLTAIAVTERELPDAAVYDAFVEFPQEINMLLRMIERLPKKPDSPTE